MGQCLYVGVAVDKGHERKVEYVAHSHEGVGHNGHHLLGFGQRANCGQNTLSNHSTELSRIKGLPVQETRHHLHLTYDQAVDTRVGILTSELAVGDGVVGNLHRASTLGFVPIREQLRTLVSQTIAQLEVREKGTHPHRRVDDVEYRVLNLTPYLTDVLGNSTPLSERLVSSTKTTVVICKLAHTLTHTHDLLDHTLGFEYNVLRLLRELLKTREHLLLGTSSRGTNEVLVQTTKLGAHESVCPLEVLAQRLGFFLGVGEELSKRSNLPGHTIHQGLYDVYSRGVFVFVPGPQIIGKPLLRRGEVGSSYVLTHLVLDGLEGVDRALWHVSSLVGPDHFLTDSLGKVVNHISCLQEIDTSTSGKELSVSYVQIPKQHIVHLLGSSFPRFLRNFLQVSLESIDKRSYFSIHSFHQAIPHPHHFPNRASSSSGAREDSI